MSSHADIVVDQFTRQAAPFANSAAMRDEEALRLLVEFSGAGADRHRARRRLRAGAGGRGVRESRAGMRPASTSRPR